MIYVPTSQLQGLSLEIAECFGKPHIGAFYKGQNVKSHSLEDGSCCSVCYRPATNVHHVVPLGKAKSFTLQSLYGTWELNTALFALCGSGTTGCHNDFHGGARYKARWVWNNDENMRSWWSGQLLHLYGPHSEELFMYGHWEIDDLKTGKSFQVMP